MNLQTKQVTAVYQALAAIGLVNDRSIDRLVESWLEWQIEQEQLEQERIEWEADAFFERQRLGIDWVNEGGDL